MSHLKAEDLRALEQSRQKLHQLSQSIGSLKEDVIRNPPMPQWESIQNQASILAQNLKSISDHLSTNADLFSRIVAYPSTNYPGRTQENILTMLLRKKAEPQVDNWVDDGRSYLEKRGETEGKDLEEVWNFASDNIGQMVGKAAVRVMRDLYTKEEREAGVKNARTGLKKPPEDEEGSEDSDDDEADDEDEEMGDGDEESDGEPKKKVVVGARSLDDMMMFMTTGRMPGGRPG